MRLLMVSGDRQVSIGERGPFHSMQREFSRYFERIDVICPRPPGPVTVRVIHDNVHFHPAQCGRSGMVRYIAAKGEELIAEHGHELIVSHDYGWFYNGLGSWRVACATGVPYLSELHHVPGHPLPADLRERFDKLVARFYVRWARTKAIGFRVVNQDEMPALLHRWHVPPEKVIVLPSLYIDLDVFHPPSAADEQHTRGEQHQQEAPQADLVYVGRMVANKGVDRILDALALLDRQGRPYSAVLVGKGPLAADMRRRAAHLGIADRVRFVEWVDSPEQLAELYRSSRLCVCASTCEGGPRFTVEAMACGTPVVSTPVGVMGDLLGDGRAGALARFDTADLANVIGHVLGNEEGRRRMGERAVEIARGFEYARAIGVYANGLRALVGKEPIGTPEEPTS